MAISEQVARFLQSDVRLVCPCGKPLTIHRDDDGKWSVGDFWIYCSPIISGMDLTAVMEKWVTMNAEGTYARRQTKDTHVELVEPVLG